MSEELQEMAADDRPGPRAKYLVGLAGYERPRPSPAIGSPSPRRLSTVSPRERLLQGAVSVFAARGFSGATVMGIVAEAQSSSLTFYENFETKDECFRVVFDLAAVRLRERIELAGGQGSASREHLRSMLVELLRFVELDSDFARVLLVASRSASPAERLRCEELMEETGRGLLSGAFGEAEKDIASFIARGVMGSIETLLRGRLQNPEESRSGDQLLLSRYQFASLYVDHGVVPKEGE
jgi:AcrR family transcriptional regulator